VERVIINALLMPSLTAASVLRIRRLPDSTCWEWGRGNIAGWSALSLTRWPLVAKDTDVVRQGPH